MGESTRICRKCLLRDTPEDEIYQNMHDYLERLPEEDKAAPELYEERLSVCRACDMLLSGMCRLCGCYVEMRAGIKKRACPHVPKKW